MILKMAVFNKVDYNEREPAINSMAMMRVTGIVLGWIINVNGQKGERVVVILGTGILTTTLYMIELIVDATTATHKTDRALKLHSLHTDDNNVDAYHNRL